MHTRLITLALAVGFLMSTAACGVPAAPRQRPIEMGPVDTGPNSLEAVRRQLSGTWDLVSLDTFPKADGAAVPIANAKAVLTYDDYGNLTIKGADATRMLDYSGRALIDVAKQQLYFRGVEGNVEELPKEIDIASTRKYAFDGGLLKISTIDAQGRVTGTSVWKRRAQ